MRLHMPDCDGRELLGLIHLEVASEAMLYDEGMGLPACIYEFPDHYLSWLMLPQGPGDEVVIALHRICLI